MRVPTRRVLRQEPGGTGEDKTLTNLLLGPRGEFKAFGKKAREEYQRVLEGTWRAACACERATAGGSLAPAGGVWRARAARPLAHAAAFHGAPQPPPERGDRCDLLFFEKFKMLLHEGSQGALARCAWRDKRACACAAHARKAFRRVH
jgi:hypothetical protein